MENKSPWVKASERLPKKYLGSPRHVFIDGSPAMGNFYEDYVGEKRVISFGVTNPVVAAWSIPQSKFDGLEWYDGEIFTTLQSENDDLKEQNRKIFSELENLQDSLAWINLKELQSENARLQSEVEQLKATIEGMEANYYSPDEITAIKEASYHAGKVGGYY